MIFILPTKQFYANSTNPAMNIFNISEVQFHTLKWQEGTLPGPKNVLSMSAGQCHI